MDKFEITPRLCDPGEMRRRALQGDVALIEDVVDCFRDDLVLFLKYRCKNETDAEDAVQDTLESALKHMETYRGDSALRSWLYTLASNACSRMRRGQKNDPALHAPLEPQSHRPEYAAGSIDDAVATRLIPLRAVLSDLKSVDRAVLMLRDGEGMTTREVAESLSLTEPAVKARLHRARKQVQTALRP